LIFAAPVWVSGADVIVADYDAAYKSDACGWSHASHSFSFDCAFTSARNSLRSHLFVANLLDPRYVVYDPRVALPKYVVHFGGGGGVPRAPAPVVGKKITIVDSKEKVSTDLNMFFFNEACTQFYKLCPGASSKITAVDYYGAIGGKLESVFQACQGAFAQKNVDDSAIWVFHGTKTHDNIASIMKEGFKVGGQDGHPVAHGTACGRGVYSAIGPQTPMGYGGATKAVILCKALPGAVGAQEVADSWNPHGDWRIFKTSQQVLPFYVLHFA
jgi:hypothetical protein